MHAAPTSDNEMPIITRKRGDKAICQHCGKEYVMEMKTQKNCSSECGMAAWQQKMREKKLHRQYKIYERDDFRCLYCGKSSIEDQTELVVDHVISLPQGGTNDSSNLVTCCATCNIVKGGFIQPPDTIERIRAEIARREQRIAEVRASNKQ